MKINADCKERRKRRWCATTLVEVVIAMALTGVVTGGVLSGYVMSSRRAEWSSYSLAAHSLAMQRVEQARAAKCTPLLGMGIDEVQATNFPAMASILDIPVVGTNYAWATTYTTVTIVSADPLVKMIRADCVWRFKQRNYYSNSMIVYRTVDR
jgi:type II secretory pathway pseudopilin PulG